MRSVLTGAPPHPLLREHVLRYAGFEETTPHPVRRREPAYRGVAVILTLEGEWRLEQAGARQTERSFVGGLSDGPVLVEHAGHTVLLQFDCTPLGARRLLGVPGAELAGRCVDVGAVLGRAGTELVEQLHGLPDWPRRFAALDAFLLERLAAAAPVAPDVAFAWERLTATAGRLPIGALTRELGCSPRHLASRFREEVGLTPKAYARVVRFEGALHRLRAGAPPADVALAAGYYDQAHLNREFRALAGLPPTALLAEDAAVTFVQDAAARAA